MTRRAVFSFFVLYVILLQPVYGEDTGVIRTEDVLVLFEEPLKGAAKEVTDIYPEVKMELEESLRWKLNFRPTVLLIKSREKFERMAGTDRIVAFAIPEKNLVVIDYSRMNTPSTVGPPNWCWRLLPGALTEDVGRRLLEMTAVYGRRRSSTTDE